MTLRIAQQTIDGLDDDVNDIDIFPLVEATNVVGLCNLTIVEDHIDGTSVIYDVEPIAHILTLSIDRKGLAMTDVVDEKWNQLFRELIGAIVVGAVGHDGGHAIGVVISSHEVVATCLRG